jgi:O-succinylhomoserine sulfhydrylase
LQQAGAFASAYKLLFVVDNCFATPYLQQPLQYGADIIVHSATKYIDGQGRILGGIVCSNDDQIDKVRTFCRRTGPALSPFNAWILSKSLETLAVRMDRHCSNALTLAEHFSHHPKLNWVKYPFLKSHKAHDVARRQMKAGGGIVCFELADGLSGGASFLDKLKMLSLTANLGDTRSIASHPASTTHAKLSREMRLKVGITDGLIRISVGLEHIDDIIRDIEQAL